MKNEASVRILGTRGSIPVGGKAFQKYGGATTCVLVRLAGQVIVLDAGTGLLSLPSYLKKKENQVSLLLSHPHADHLLGFPMCSLMLEP
ncbi:MAG: MBL fold metallo-hydrolase, partial [Anaerotignum sp.]